MESKGKMEDQRDTVKMRRVVVHIFGMVSVNIRSAFLFFRFNAIATFASFSIVNFA